MVSFNPTSNEPFVLMTILGWFSERGEMKLAVTHFENALRNGSPFEAYYYLAQFQARTMRTPSYPQHITSSACSVAASFYKVVAERGVWDVDLVSQANIAWASGNDRNREIAMLQWWIAAERGYEPAQNNMAYVLDQGPFASSSAEPV